MIKTETLQFKVVYDTRDGISNLGYLQEAYNKLGEARRNANSVDDEKRIIKEQDLVREKINQQREALGNLGLTSIEIGKKIKDLSFDLRSMIPGSEKAQEFRAEIEKLRAILNQKNNINNDREIEELRLIIKDSGTAALSTKQLETVAKHMYATMVNGAKSGSIANHELYNEWVMISGAIQNSSQSLNQNTIAQKAYEAELNKIVATQGIQALNTTQLEDYSQKLYKTIIEESKNAEISQHGLYNEWLKTGEAISFAKDSLNQKVIAQKTYEAEIDNIVKTQGLEALSVQALEDYSKRLYTTITTGAKSSKIQEHELYNEWVRSNALIKQNKDAVDKAKIAQAAYEKELKHTVETQGKEALSLEHLREYYKLLKKEIEETADFESEVNQNRIKEAQETDKMIEAKDAKIKGSTSFFNQIKSQLPSAVAGAFGGMFVGLAQQIGETFFSALSAVSDKIKKKSREITEIEVALDTTRGVASRLRKELNDIKTETSVEELQKLAVAAGDLNVATEEVKSFVTEADKIGVVMKKDFGGSTEEAVTMIAKLKGEFKETKELKFGDSMAKIGSVLKGLNLDGPASTQGITDFLKRAGAIPATLKPSITELAAYAAVFEEANLSSEISASGFSKILTVGANNLTAFAKQMRMSREELANLINSNPNDFVIKFTKSLEGLSGTQTAQTLKKLKLESDETFKVVGVLTDNIDKLNRKQAISNNLFADGTTVNKIFNKYLNDEAGQIAQVEKAWNRITSSFTTFLVKVASPFIMFLAESTEKSKDLAEQYSDQKKSVDRLNNATEPMIQRYEKLSLKAKILGGQQHLLTSEQNELNRILNILSNTLPATAIQFGKYGEVIGINTEKAREFIKVQKAMLKAQNADVINQTQKEIDSKNAELTRLQNKFDDTNLRVTKDRTGKEAYQKIKRSPLENTFMSLEEYRKGKQMINDLKTQIDEGEAALKGFKGDLLEIPPVPAVVTPPEDGKKGGKGGKGDTGDDTTTSTGGNNKATAHKKYLQDSEREMIELRAKLAFEERLASANEHEKKVLQAEKQAKDELKQVRTQFKDENGLLIEKSKLSIEQKKIIAREEALISNRLNEQKIQLQKELNEKLDAQYEAQANRSVEIAINARRDQLSANLDKAEKTGSSTDVLNAKIDLQSFDEKTTLFNLQKKYLEEQTALKDNKAGLELLEKNYQDERNRITEKGTQDRDKLIADSSEKELNKAKKDKLDKLSLNVKQAEQTAGGDVFQAQKDLLTEQMNQELSVKNLTEAEKSNIQKKYALERASLEKASFQGIAQEAVQLFSQAYSGISNIFKANLATQEQEQNDKYQRDKAKLDNQKDKKIITEAEYNTAIVKLNQKLEKEQKKIKREQAISDRASNITQITISGILAAMKAYEQAGPFGGTIGAIIMGGITAANIAAVLAEPLPSLLVGGKTNKIHPGSDIDGMGGFLAINHPNEFMSNPIATSNPVWPIFEPMLEMLNAGQTPNIYAGKSTTSTGSFSPNVSSTAFAKFETTVDAFASHVQKLGDYVSNPQQNFVVFGHKEVYDLEQMKNELNTTLSDANATTNNSLIK